MPGSTFDTPRLPRCGIGATTEAPPSRPALAAGVPMARLAANLALAHDGYASRREVAPMRALAMVILALSTVGCAPAGLLQLAPRETSHSSQANARWIASESSQSTVSASVERAWLDHLLFEVEVVNQSDSMLVVEPGQFSLTLSSSADLPDRRPPGPIAPASAERVRARLERESVVAPGLGEAAYQLAGLALATVVVAALVAGGEFPDLAPSDSEEQQAPAPDPHVSRRADAVRVLERLPQTLLGRTELAPGASVRGELWFPAHALRRSIQPEPADEHAPTEWSITSGSRPRRRHVEYGLTLRAPAALGGQQIDYFAWRE